MIAWEFSPIAQQSNRRAVQSHPGRIARRLLGLAFSCLLAGFVPAVANAESAECLKVVTHNVWYGFTKKPAPRHEQWRQWLQTEAPDVVCLQELNGYTPDKLAADAAAWGHKHSVLLKTDGFPTGITSNRPIHDVRRLQTGFHHGLLRCRIGAIWFYVIHFDPSDFQHRIEEAELLWIDIATLPGAEPQIVLAGDFNGFSPADKNHYDSDDRLVPFFRQLDARIDDDRNLNDGRLDYGGIQAILDRGFLDVVAARRTPGEEFIGTFPTPLVNDVDHGSSRRLDYIFVSANLADRVTEAAIIRTEQTEMLSDHLPVTATLRLGDQ